jgi:protein-disulfide isomerase
VQQNKIQACIQKLSSSKYWDYSKTFAEEIYEKCYGNITCDLTESTKLMKSLGIDSSAILSCVKSEGETLINADYASAEEEGVTGSPTLIVNGVKVSVSRTAEAYKEAVCSAFNNVPSECSQTLDSTGEAASGNC